MIPISPITMETITPHIGLPVCAVMADGARHVGILRGVGDGMLHLDVPSQSMTLASVKGRKTGPVAKMVKAGHAGNPGFARIQAAKARNVQNAGPKKPTKLQTKAWGYGPYGGWGAGWGLGWGFRAAAFGLAALTALFLIPWFWI